MRVLAVVRPDAAVQPGGDLIHAENAATALRALGVEVEFVASAAPDARAFDVAHVFGVFEPDTARAQFAAIRRTGTPLVLSPIWLDLSEYLAIAPQVEHALAARRPADAFAKLARRHDALLRGRDGRNAGQRLAAQRELVESADFVLPASKVESRPFGSSVPFAIAPLGIDEALFKTAVPVARSGVLCAARIESKKNQAALLYALRDADVDVTLVGRAYDARYLELCRRLAGPRARFIDHVPQSELFALMRTAAVHAHPSWCESPGLSSLEAGALGARIVTGDRGSEREYFGPHAHCADPADPQSIRAAVIAALTEPPRSAGDAFEQRLRTFSWRRHAEVTLEGYERALARHR